MFFRISRWYRNKNRAKELAKLQYENAKRLTSSLKDVPDFWGRGFRPSIAFDYRAAWEMVLHYGLVLKVTGQVTQHGHQYGIWYAWYPEERWRSGAKPQWHPAAHGQGLTLCDAVTRCLIDCARQKLLGPERKDRESSHEVSALKAVGE